MSSSSSPPAPSAEAPSNNPSIVSSSPPKMISPPPNKCKPKTPPALPTALARPLLANILGEIFPPFDHDANIVTPFNNEVNRDTAFEKELGAMLLNAILETHAWAAARPKHESSLAAQSIEKKVVSIMETEKEQGMSLLRPRLSSSVYAGIVDKTRQQLNQFVTQIKTALAALTGLVGI